MDIRMEDGEMETVIFHTVKKALEKRLPKNLKDIEADRDRWWIINKDVPYPPAPSFPCLILPRSYGDLFIVTTPWSLEGQILKFLKIEDRKYIRDQKTREGKVVHSALDESLIDWGRFQFIVVDDWDSCKGKDMKLIQFLSRCAEGQNPPHMCVSSKAMSTRSGDVVGWHQVLWQPIGSTTDY